MNTRTIQSKESLIEAIGSGLQPKYLFFWGHQPAADGRTTKTCLSQWFASPFEVQGVLYPTAEHFMMARKAELFGDFETMEKVLQAKDPGKAKALGRTVKGFDESVWVENRWAIVVDANAHKFAQNRSLADFLIGTSNRVLVEANPLDSIWGIGLDAASPFAEKPSKWPGLNLLGFALMKVRSSV